MFSFLYSLRDEKGIDVHICQKGFCCIHGFGHKTLQMLRRKLGQDPELEPDRRGKHCNYQRVDEEIKN